MFEEQTGVEFMALVDLALCIFFFCCSTGVFIPFEVQFLQCACSKLCQGRFAAVNDAQKNCELTYFYVHVPLKCLR